ncbi:helix-turn-helix domain-containing protein [Amycolatopsis pittospori]|uniref:helix-turn-helix domain-containing protein n=1 Tax=Amycolatopsis pittospori TaxID=2749434 RepID=UPI001F26D6C3|nr:helix-turn-helix domain-containing protein [Amycolatopsis pittospori]
MRETIGGRGVLEGAFTLLEALDDHGGQAGLTQLVRASGLPKTTVHRLLDQMVGLGAVERAGVGYRIGSRVFRLGRFWQPELRDLAKEWLPSLSTRMRASLVLVVPREGRALVAAGAVLPSDDVPVVPGGPLPPGTAAGRLLAAHHPALAEPDGGAREIRTAGFAVESGTITSGLGCAAVPIRTPDGRVGAALAAVLRTSRNYRIQRTKRVTFAFSPLNAVLTSCNYRVQGAELCRWRTLSPRTVSRRRYPEIGGGCLPAVV